MRRYDYEKFDWALYLVLIIGVMIAAQFFVLSFPELFPIEK